MIVLLDLREITLTQVKFFIWVKYFCGGASFAFVAEHLLQRSFHLQMNRIEARSSLQWRYIMMQVSKVILHSCLHEKQNDLMTRLNTRE